MTNPYNQMTPFAKWMMKYRLKALLYLGMFIFVIPVSFVMFLYDIYSKEFPYFRKCVVEEFKLLRSAKYEEQQ